MLERPTLLVVDADRAVACALQKDLEGSGYTVLISDAAESALATSLLVRPDLVITELRLPGIGGIELTRRLCAQAIPVLILAGEASRETVVIGLRTGACDFVHKPVVLPEFLARVEVALRRATRKGETDQPLSVGKLTLDFQRRRVAISGRDIPLTHTEYRVLAELGTSPGTWLQPEELLARVWGPDHGQDRDYLRTYIMRLRRKIEVDPGHPRYIQSRAGFGYALGEG